MPFNIWKGDGFKNLKRKRYVRAIEQHRATFCARPYDELMPMERWFQAENIGKYWHDKRIESDKHRQEVINSMGWMSFHYNNEAGFPTSAQSIYSPIPMIINSQDESL